MKLNNRTKLSLVTAGVGGAAVAGFGLAAGRDIYKGTKNSAGFFLLLAAVLGTVLVCPFIGGRGLVRGHDRGFIGTLFLTYIGSFLLFSISILASSAFTLYFLSSTASNNQSISVQGAVIIGTTFTLFIGIIGILVGLYERPNRLRRFSIVRENESFLRDNGFQETNGTDITHYDLNGNALRLLEAHPTKIVFMAVGRRGKRAFIDLDKHGKMIAYSGIT